MVWLKVILIIGVLSINGCATSGAVVQKNPKVMTMMDIYAKSTHQAKADTAQFIENNLKEQNTFGYVKPYIPVMNEPLVRKVWIPDHKSQDDADVMIAGHWNYVMIKPSMWFIDGNTLDSRMPVVVPGLAEEKVEKKSQEEMKQEPKKEKKQEKKEYGHNNRAIRKNI